MYLNIVVKQFLNKKIVLKRMSYNYRKKIQLHNDLIDRLVFLFFIKIDKRINLNTIIQLQDVNLKKISK